MISLPIRFCREHGTEPPARRLPVPGQMHGMHDPNQCNLFMPWKVTEPRSECRQHSCHANTQVTPALRSSQYSGHEGHSVMPTNAKQAADQVEDAMTQISRLREQVESLIRDRVGPAIEDATERAEAASAAVRERADELAGAVRRQPFTAILAAAAVGFLLGRVSR